MLVIIISVSNFYLSLATDPASVEQGVIDSTVNETFSVSLVCNVSGIPRPNITWYRYQSSPVNKTAVIDDDIKFNITESHVIGNFNLVSVTSILTILDADKSDEQSYQCVGRNGVKNAIDASSSSTAFLTVQGIHVCVCTVHVLIYMSVDSW